MGIVHADFNEFREITYKSILIHPEIKTVLLSLELETLIPFRKIKKYDFEKYNTKLTFREAAELYLITMPKFIAKNQPGLVMKDT